MYPTNFLENLWKKIKAKEVPNSLNPVPLHHGLAYTMQLQDRITNLLWLPYEHTGIAYSEKIGGSINIFPYYKGQIIEEFEISHGMDLHKPKTEDDVLQHMYSSSWELHQIFSHEKYAGSAADYMYKFHHLCIFLNYFNSLRVIPVPAVK
ncbi:hypothetical protein [Paenibacillus agricola]|uniref:Uncharacterized protein n=1 Tax=Paenibacillus agricola TaxID=2716264 RepID=A0ABX0J372_9BACL|nr:hypothetical protein [Paenibacillus agricola]NHN30817.1 hypothetical protein [Paenibacillus agricola]